MPASASLSIPAIAEHLGRMELPDPVVLAPALSTALGGVVDLRKVRGIRHRLVVLLTVTVCAVAAGARSFVAVADAFDAVIGGFIQQLCTAVPVKGRRRVLAVDGKTLRVLPTQRPRRAPRRRPARPAACHYRTHSRRLGRM
ncbi:MAG: ISAs1 family transposase [Thermomicrobiales bacterium]|nr:ISAs1 family transposase [Thermomicrobiales bacterium]